MGISQPSGDALRLDAFAQDPRAARRMFRFTGPQSGTAAPGADWHVAADRLGSLDEGLLLDGQSCQPAQWPSSWALRRA